MPNTKPEPLEQRVVIYDAQGGSVRVYATVYTDEEAAASVRSCTRRYGGGNARSRWASEVADGKHGKVV